MEFAHEIEREDGPRCRGPGVLEEENGWCVYVTCLDCGCHTAELPFTTPEEKLEAAKRVAGLWNHGKVVHSGTV